MLTPSHKPLTDLAETATRISVAVSEIENIETEWRPYGWVLRMTPDAMVELVESLANGKVTEGFIEDVHQQIRSLPDVEYLVDEGVLKIEIPELSLLNAGVWILQNVGK